MNGVMGTREEEEEGCEDGRGRALHRGGHFITLCDLNSNRLMAKAACRCKRPRKRHVKRRDLKKRKKRGL